MVDRFKPDYTKIDAEIDKVNLQFNSVTIRRRGQKLSMRAVCPNKLDEPIGSKRRDISVRAHANSNGLAIAKAKAQKLESDLALERFSWADWEPCAPGKAKSKTAADWGKEFGRYKSRSIRASSFRKDYKTDLNRLPEEPLTVKLLQNLILEHSPQLPGTPGKVRNRMVMVYQQLARYADLPCDLRHLRVSYKPAPIDPSALPTDDEIIEIWDSLEEPEYKWCYGMMATYGLRPHELYRLENYKAIASKTGAITVGKNSKTGRHVVWSCPDEWRHRFNLVDVQLPKIGVETKDNQEIGARLSQEFRKRFPHIAYALRHAYAIRTALMGVPDSVAAKWMGHSVAVHTATYHAAISMAQHESVWKRINNKTGEK